MRSTREIRRRVLELHAQGMKQMQIAEEVGFGVATVNRWITQSRQQSLIMQQFLACVRKALRTQKMTQKTLALRAELDRSRMARMFSSRQRLSLDEAVRVLDALGFELAIRKKRKPR